MRDAPHHNASDIPRGNWLDRYAPARARPYARLMRLDRPIGTWLLLLPGWWALAIPAEPGAWPNLLWVALFGVGKSRGRVIGTQGNVDLWVRHNGLRVGKGVVWSCRTADRVVPVG